MASAQKYIQSWRIPGPKPIMPLFSSAFDSSVYVENVLKYLECLSRLY